MRITKDFKFEASHVVPGHPGKCQRLHGHSYVLHITVHGTVHPATGFIVDFGDIKAMVQPLIDTLDHRHLNFFIANPTAENIAAWFGQRLSRIVDRYAITGLEVTVLETATSSATWDSRLEVDAKHGQNPSIYGTGIPVAHDGLSPQAQIGPVIIPAAEYESYMTTFRLARRACARRINLIREHGRELLPAKYMNQLGTVKEQ